jgi:hypothetical protein
LVKTPHQTHIEISPSVSRDLDVGAHVTLNVKISCSSGCDLSGAPISITATEGIVAIGKTGAFTFQAPKQVGEYTWMLVFPRHETDAVIHQETFLPISFKTLPHKTSITVWDVPSPVVMNRSFHAKVGIKCAACCRLTGQTVEVRDEAGNKTGEGTLGETPWQGTDALYWADANVTAPTTAGMSSWIARFTGAGQELAHEEASVNLNFRVDTPPEHRVTIKVIAEDTQTPIGNAEVRFGLYTSFTDEGGFASFELPKGTYDLRIWKDGYKGPPMSVDVSADETILVEALKVLTEAEVEDAIRRFEASTWG